MIEDDEADPRALPEELFAKSDPQDELEELIKATLGKEAYEARFETLLKEAAEKEAAKKKTIDKDEKRNLDKRVFSELSLYNIFFEQVIKKYFN
ncbi:MAG: hypothetical protein KME38_25345 [Spirirestis rafaelensis WJT71-NPBG6]|jgi:hypothetical protein|nr:hypothetical protein [Spirirestis rafaelensis WJT71-NPBG6]